MAGDVGRQALIEGASPGVCEALGIPADWAAHCEDASHQGHDDTVGALGARLDRHEGTGSLTNLDDKLRQLGSYGGGNHFGECEIVSVHDDERARRAAATFGLIDGGVAFLSHCGSRGIGHLLAAGQFKALQRKFSDWDIPLPDVPITVVPAAGGAVEVRFAGAGDARGDGDSGSQAALGGAAGG